MKNHIHSIGKVTMHTLTKLFICLVFISIFPPSIVAQEVGYVVKGKLLITTYKNYRADIKKMCGELPNSFENRLNGSNSLTEKEVIDLIGNDWPGLFSVNGIDLPAFGLDGIAYVYSIKDKKRVHMSTFILDLGGVALFNELKNHEDFNDFPVICGEDITRQGMTALEKIMQEAEDGNVYSQYKLATCYIRTSSKAGYCPEEDLSEAVKWYRKAAEQGHSSAQGQLGKFYMYGTGVSRDYSEAQKWLSKASAQGNQHSEALLSNIDEIIAKHERMDRAANQPEKGEPGYYERGSCGSFSCAEADNLVIDQYIINNF